MSKTLFYTLLGVVYGVLLAISLWGSQQTGYHLWLLVIAIAGYHAIDAPKTIEADELAVTDTFGHLSEHLPSGLHIVPYPVRLHRVTKNDIKVNFGTLDEAQRRAVQNSRDTGVSVRILEEAIRITFGNISAYEPEPGQISKEEAKARYADNLLARDLTVDPHMYFTFKTHNLKTLIEVAGDLNKAIDRIKSTYVRVLSVKAGKTFPAYALSHMTEFMEAIFAELEFLVGDPDAPDTIGKRKKGPSWGANVLEIGIESLGIPHKTNTALAERSALIAKAEGEAVATVNKSRADREATENEALGASMRIREVGNAEADSIKVKGKATAQALANRAKAVQEPGGELILKTDAWSEVAKGGKVVIVPTDSSAMTELFKAQAVIDASKT